MYNEICKYIKENNMLRYGDKVVIGLSGGADSVCLFRILCSLKDRYGLTLYAIHINHGIRGKAADDDAQFCKRLAEEYNVPYRCVVYDIPGIAAKWKVTEEEAGRTVRYREFRRELTERDADKIAVAHHMNDDVETILFRMCRGTGIKGMTGIPCVRDNIIRPLLNVSKSEILGYLQELGQDYREDITNSDSSYDRNRIRNIVIPELMKINGAAVEHISVLSKQLGEIYSWYEQSADIYYEQNVCEGDESASVSVRAIREAPGILAGEIIRRMIGELSGSLKDVEKRHIALVYELTSGETGRSVNLPYNLKAEKEYDVLRISVINSRECGNNEYSSLVPSEKEEQLYISNGVYLPDDKIYCNSLTVNFKLVNNSVDINNIPKNNCTKWFDYGKISSKLVLRRPEPEDYISIGEGKNKKLTRYMIDSKIPRRYRNSLLVAAEDSRVIWIVGGRSSRECYVTHDTDNILQIVIDYS